MSDDERRFRDAVSDFEMTHGDYLEDPALYEVALERARQRVLDLYAKKARSTNASVNEALNSGDGTYKP